VLQGALVIVIGAASWRHHRYKMSHVHSNGFETRLRIITVPWTFSRSSRTLLGAGSICIYNVNKEPVRTALRTLRNRRRLRPTRVPKDVEARSLLPSPPCPSFSFSFSGSNFGRAGRIRVPEVDRPCHNPSGSLCS